MAFVVSLPLRTRRFFVVLSLLWVTVVRAVVAVADDEFPTTTTTSNEADDEARPVGGVLHQWLAAEFRRHGTLAGRRARPWYREWSVTRREAAVLWQSLRTTVHVADLGLLAALGWCTVPLFQVPYEVLLSVGWFRNNSKNPKSERRPYRNTVYYQIASHLQQISQIALLVYLVDIFKLVALGLGLQKDPFKSNNNNGFPPHAFA